MRNRGRVDRAVPSLGTKIGWACLFTTLTAASAVAQVVGDPNTDPSPIEDTWRYLLEMFRLLLGL